MDVADIHALPFNVAGWVLFIEGIDIAFTNIPDLVGSGVSSWIGTGEGAREVKLGLIMPAELHYGESDPWEAEIVDSTPAAFTVVDLDGTLVSLFIDDEPDETTETLGQRLHPLTSPAPDPGIGLDGALITLWDRHVGIERIGPAGERRHFYITPDDEPSGLDHLAAVGWPSAHVTAGASLWAGRKVAVYRVVQDPDSGIWPAWGDQYAGGSLWWFGTMTDRGEWKDVTDSSTTPATSGRGYVFYCHGPASWTQRTANLSRPTTWYKPETGATLTGTELEVAAWIEPVEWEPLGDGIGYSQTLFTSHTLKSGDDLTGLSTASEYWEQIKDIVYTMIDGTDRGTVLGADSQTWTGAGPAAKGRWNTGVAPKDVRRVRISNNGSLIEIKCDNEPTEYGYRVCIAADARVWQAAGWDINTAPFESRKALQGKCPVGGANWGEAAGDEILGPFHVVGCFSTRDEINEFGNAFVSNWDNDGNWKGYEATFPTGVVTLDPDGGTEVFVAYGTVRCEGQHGQPFTLGSQIDGADCDASGWWLFRGQRLTVAGQAAGEEGSLYIGVALCEWVSTSDGDEVEVNSEGMATIRVVRWEDPRAFGLPFDRFEEPWVNAVGVLECAPIGVFGGIAIPGWRHRMIVSALLSTGTSTWDTTGNEVTITAGSNHPPDMIANETAGDIEVADLGLGIPHPFVDWQSFYLAASQLPGGVSGALNRILYVLYGSQKISTVLRECMAGAGWAWSLMRRSGEFVPAFGCYDPLRLIQPGDVVATLTRADMAELGIEEGPQWRGTVETRRGGPYDTFEFEVGREPIDAGGKPYTITMESTDPGRRHRSGKIPWMVVDSGLRDPMPWLGTPGQQQYDWTGHARNRFAAGIGPRLAKRQHIYRAVYNARFAGVLGLGSQVHVIDGTAETPSGTRGVNHRGRVIECSIIAKGTGKCSVRVAVELERKGVDEVRVWGPYAFSGRGGWDSATSILTITEDHALVGDGHSDTTGWTQPQWDSHDAGELEVWLYESENGGVTWTLALSATIAAVDAGAGTIELDNISGSAYRDTYKLLVPNGIWDFSVEWPFYVFAPSTYADGFPPSGVRLK